MMRMMVDKGNQERAGLSGTLEAGESLRRRVQERAYELFVRRGRGPGHDVQDWLEAEKQVLGEIASRAGSGSALRATPPEIDKPLPGRRPAPAPANRRRI